MVRLRSGRPQPFPTPEEAAAHEYTGPERALLATMDRAPVVGAQRPWPPGSGSCSTGPGRTS